MSRLSFAGKLLYWSPVTGIMELHWRDVKNPNEEWSYLEVSIPEDIRPRLRLLSGGNLRFKLEGKNGTLCWGNIDKEFYGA